MEILFDEDDLEPLPQTAPAPQPKKPVRARAAAKRTDALEPSLFPEEALEPPAALSEPALEFGVPEVDIEEAARRRAVFFRGDEAPIPVRRSAPPVFDDSNPFEGDEEVEPAKAPKKKTVLRDRPSILKRAVAALARREFPRAELRARLLRGLSADETAADVDAALAKLGEWGYLSDERFAKGRARVSASRLGDARIRRDLRRSGVDAETVDEALASIEEPEELRAWRLWSRRFGERPKDLKERDRQIRWLAYRGFSMRSIMKVLRGEVELPEEDEDPFMVFR